MDQTPVTYVSEGESLPHTPVAAVTAGQVVIKDGNVTVAKSDIAANKPGNVAISGVFEGPKVNGAIADNQALYWDADGNPEGGVAGSGALTTTQSAGPFAGFSVGSAGASDPLVKFRLRSALGGGLRIAAGQHTTVAASDTVVTGLTKVLSVVASLESDLVDDPMLVTSQIGDQAGAPAAGSIILKTWKNTSGTDPTPAAATTFTKKVNWIAIGT